MNMPFNQTAVTFISIFLFLSAGHAESVDIEAGAQQYDRYCASCHGDQGESTQMQPLTGPSCETCDDTAALIAEISNRMPLTNPGACDQSCAANTAAFIQNGFTTQGYEPPKDDTDNDTDTGTHTPLALTCWLHQRIEHQTAEDYRVELTLWNSAHRDMRDWRVTWSTPSNHHLHAYWDAELIKAGSDQNKDFYEASIVEDSLLDSELNASFGFMMQANQAQPPTQFKLIAQACEKTVYLSGPSFPQPSFPQPSFPQ